MVVDLLLEIVWMRPHGSNIPGLKFFLQYNLSIFWFLVLAGLSFLPWGYAEDLKVRSQFDIRHPERKLISVKARIQGLPEGSTTLRFASTPLKPEQQAPRILHFEVRDSSGELMEHVENGGSWSIETINSEAIDLSYQISLRSAADHLERVHLDDSRAVLSVRELLPSFESGRAHISVSFLLPPSWKVVSQAIQDKEEDFEIDSNAETFFYLGKATERKITINSVPMVLALEKDWPVEADRTLRELKRQIHYLGKSSREWQAQPSLVFFLADWAGVTKTRAEPIRGEGLMTVVAPPRKGGEEETLRLVKRRIAEGLVPCFLPVFGVSPIPESLEPLRQYLVWKTLLKTGAVLPTTFLDQMAQGFRTFINPPRSRHIAPPDSSGGAIADVSAILQRRISVQFLTDLSLTFNRKGNNALFDLLKTLSDGSRDAAKIEDELLKRSYAEKEYRYIRQLWQGHTEEIRFPELLKPYGLFLVKVEIPKLDLILSEAFRVRQIVPGGTFGRLQVQVGDRLLAVNDFRLVTPEDWLKARSLLRGDNEAVLTVERAGNILRIKQPWGTEILVKLEVNKLSDADKQDRLETFLSKEVED